jgi:large subunit ribosomal protein L17
LQPDRAQARDDVFGQGQGRPFRRRKDGHAGQEGHQESAAKTLFTEIAPAFKDRRSGYTRIIKLGQRQGDASQSAILEWVDAVVPAAAPVAPAAEAKPEEKK